MFLNQNKQRMMKTIKTECTLRRSSEMHFHCSSEQRERTKLQESRENYRNNFCCSTAKITGIIQRVRDYGYNPEHAELFL